MPHPSLAASARVSLQTALDSTPRDLKRSAEKAFAAATSARERAAHPQPALALEPNARWLPELADKPHWSRTALDTALDRSECSDPKRCSERTGRPERSYRCLPLP